MSPNFTWGRSLKSPQKVTYSNGPLKQIKRNINGKNLFNVQIYFKNIKKLANKQIAAFFTKYIIDAIPNQKRLKFNFKSVKRVRKKSGSPMPHVKNLFLLQ